MREARAAAHRSWKRFTAMMVAFSVMIGTALTMGVVSASANDVTGVGPGYYPFNDTSGNIQDFNVGFYYTNQGLAMCLNPDRSSPVGKGGWGDVSVMWPGYTLTSGVTVDNVKRAQVAYLLWAHGNNGNLSDPMAAAVKLAAMNLLYGNSRMQLYPSYSVDWDLWNTGTNNAGYKLATSVDSKYPGNNVLGTARAWVTEAQNNYVTWDKNTPSPIVATIGGKPYTNGMKVNVGDVLSATWTLSGLPAGYSATWTLIDPSGKRINTTAWSNSTGVFSYSATIAEAGSYDLEVGIENVPPYAPLFMSSPSGNEQNMMLLRGLPQARTDPFFFDAEVPSFQPVASSDIDTPSVAKVGDSLADTLHVSADGSPWIDGVSVDFTSTLYGPVDVWPASKPAGSGAAAVAAVDNVVKGVPVVATQTVTASKPGDYRVGVGQQAQAVGKYFWVTRMDPASSNDPEKIMDVWTSGVPEVTERTQAQYQVTFTTDLVSGADGTSALGDTAADVIHVADSPVGSWPANASVKVASTLYGPLVDWPATVTAGAGSSKMAAVNAAMAGLPTVTTVTTTVTKPGDYTVGAGLTAADLPSQSSRDMPVRPSPPPSRGLGRPAPSTPADVLGDFRPPRMWAHWADDTEVA